MDGTLGDTAFTLYATIDGSLTFGMIRGTVAGKSIRIDAECSRQRTDVSTRLTGCYEGPLSLLALMVGALLHFI